MRKRRDREAELLKRGLEELKEAIAEADPKRWIEVGAGVICPRCGEQAILTYRRGRRNASLKCTHCKLNVRLPFNP